MASTFPLQIVSPTRIVFEGEATLVEVPGTEGDFGVLPGHAPFFSMIRPGVITIHEAGARQRLFVSAGYADVSPEGTTILSDQIRDLAQTSADDVSAALEAAQQAMDQATTDAEKATAAKQLETAQALRLAVAH